MAGNGGEKRREMQGRDGERKGGRRRGRKGKEEGDGWKKARRSEAARTVAGIKSDKIITGIKWARGLA